MEEIVIAAASSLVERYYLDVGYQGLPQSIKEELQGAIVALAASVSGVASIIIKENELVVRCEQIPGDLDFDDIHAQYITRVFLEEKKDFLEQILTYHIIFHSPQGVNIKNKLLEE